MGLAYEIGELVGPASGLTAIVTTKDTGDAGRLRIRNAPSLVAPVIGYAPHDGQVTVKDAAANGFYAIESNGVFGYASGTLLSPVGQTPSAAPANDTPDTPDDPGPSLPSAIIPGMTARTLAISAGVAGVALLGLMALAVHGRKKKSNPRRRRNPAFGDVAWSRSRNSVFYKKR